VRNTFRIGFENDCDRENGPAVSDSCETPSSGAMRARFTMPAHTIRATFASSEPPAMLASIPGNRARNSDERVPAERFRDDHSAGVRGRHRAATSSGVANDPP